MDTIHLYDSIESHDAEPFRQQLASAGPRPVVRINSPGGDVFAGIAIANAIRGHGRVRVVIDGLAASIASFIACAAATVEMADTALLMIHDPWLSASGNAAELRRGASTLDNAKAALLKGYAARANQDEAVVDGWMAAETWFTADEALAAGFVDRIISGLQLAAQLDLSRFHNLPKRIKAMTTSTTAPAPAAETPQPVDVRAAIVERNQALQARAAGLTQGYPSRSEQIRACLDEALVDLDQTLEGFTDAVLAKLAETPDQPIAGAYNTRFGEYTDAAGNFRSKEIYYPGRNAHHTTFRAAVQDALLQRAGIHLPAANPAARDVRGMSLVQIADTMLGHHGRFPGQSGISTIRAAMTTSDFPALLADTANRALMVGYENEPASHREWTKQSEVRDFKESHRVALSEAPEMLPKPEASEYQAGSMSDGVESFKLVTYGRMLQISREAMVNDDIGGFTRLPLAFGAAAARKESDVVYDLLKSNPVMRDGKPLFGADHHNLISGASHPDIVTLSNARALMRRQRGPNGGFLNPVPRFIIVPAEFETAARTLVAAERVSALQTVQRSGELTSITTAEVPNLEWINQLQVVVDPRLDDVAPIGWYLAAHWQQTDTAECIYLEGQRGVFTEEDHDFDTDMYRLKARLDFAALIPDWVGLVRIST